MYTTGLTVFVLAITIPAFYCSEAQLPIPYATTNYQTSSIDIAPKTYLPNYDEDGYNVQSGFEGYLIPTLAGAYDLADIKHGHVFSLLGAKKGLLAYLKPIGELLIKLLPKIALVVVSVGVLFLIGTVLTTAVCTFTPFCHLTIHGWNLSNDDVRGFLSNDRISEMASFVRGAIKKYQNMNKESTVSIVPKREGKLVPVTTNEVK